MHIPRLPILLIMLCLSMIQVRAQQGQWLTSDNELSSTLINQVYCDSRDMIWIVTEYGLNRYDGTKVTRYSHDRGDNTSVASDFIYNVFEDSHNRLFVSTHSGVQLYDPATDLFSEPLKVKGTEDIGVGMSHVIETPDGLYALGNFLYRIVGEGNDVCLEKTAWPAETYFAKSALYAPDGSIWLINAQGNLYRLRRNGKTRLYMGPQDQIAVSVMTFDRKGSLYVGTENRGIYQYNRVADRFEPVDLGPDLNNMCIRSLYANAQNQLLVGTDGRGLYVYDPDNNGVNKYVFPNVSSDRLKIHSVTNDTHGNLWIGVYQKGVVKYMPPSRHFHTIGQYSHSDNLIGSCCVTTIVRGANGLLYVGTDSDGIYEVDLEHKTSRHYSEGIPLSIVNITQDSNGRLWVGSYNSGAGIFDIATGKYRPLDLTVNGESVRHAYSFAEMPDGDMLISAFGNCLLRYNPTTRKAVEVLPGMINKWITTVKRSKRDGSYYLGTYDGLYVIGADLSLKKHVGSGRIVTTIHDEPNHNHIWLGTSVGLVQINEHLEVENIYTMADGLPSQNIYAIVHGDDALWLSSNRGLSKFDVYKRTFKNFGVDNGLPNNEFYKNSSFKDTEGNIYFGGISGVTYFKSSDIDALGNKMTLRITDLLLGSRNIKAGDKSGGRVVFDGPIDEASVFRLSHKDNTFTIRVSTREFARGTQTQILYSLDGDDWVAVPNNNNQSGSATLIFDNLSSGKHDLQVKVIDGGVESDTLSVAIDIDTVWYATWWAIVIYVLVGLLIIAIIIMQVIQHNRERTRAMQQKHKTEILESKLQFFTNISHEIRTPLSLVISPMNRLLKDDGNSERSESYRTVIRNANRILRLVNELMDLRKIDHGQMVLRYARINICEFLRDIYRTFDSAARTRDITLRFECEGCEDMEIWVDRGCFDKVVMNLMSNALKFTPEGGAITLAVGGGIDPDNKGPLHRYALVTVTDTGIGINPSERDNVFNRFFQASNNSVGGTGIGLHLTRQLVELHHGDITFTDNPEGQGTRFAIRLPMGCDHLQSSEMIEDNDTDIVTVSDTHLMLDDVSVSDDATDRFQPKTRDLIYVVEDDQEIRQYIVDALSKLYRVQAFANGRVALEQILVNCPDLLITDLMMPEMDGITLIRKIRQNINVNYLPIIVLTAKTDNDSNIEVMECGANAFISKPFDIDVLNMTIRNKIDTIRQLRNALSGSQSQDDKIDAIEVKSNDDKLMERVMRVINRNLSNPDMTVEMIAREIGISRVHLHRKLKELTNQSTRDFIRNIRLQAAARLLDEKRLSIQEVSELVGFKQPNNFSACFKDMYGMTPTAYANRSKK